MKAEGSKQKAVGGEQRAKAGALPFSAFCLLLSVLCFPTVAQPGMPRPSSPLYGARPETGIVSTGLPQALRDVRIEQHLNEQLPTDLVFRDETGQTVTLGQYFGKKPVILSLVYYDCPMLCTQVLSGMVSAFRVMSFSVGDQFEVVTAAELQPKWLAEARRREFRELPIGGPVLVALEAPTDEKERQVIIFSAIFGGRDAQHFTQYYVPYAEYRSAALAQAWTIERLRKHEPMTAKVTDEYLARSGTRESEVRYFRMRTRQHWIAVLVDAKSGEIVKMLLVPDS